jgi:hypothetical protein
MRPAEKAIETTATINENHELVLDEPLPLSGPARVRVIVLLQESESTEEEEWLRAGMMGSAFDFLNSEEEDIYTLDDGSMFDDKR